MAGRPASSTETSVGRALRVVEAVAEAGDGVTAKVIARRLGFSLPTTYRLLSTLVEDGYLVRLPDLRGYGLGYRIGALAQRLVEQVAAPWPVRDVLHELHGAVSGAAHYAVVRGDRVVLAELDSCPRHPAPPGLHVGDPLPACHTAAGRVLLAGLDRRRLAAVLAGPGAQAPDSGALARELEQVRELGVAVVPDGRARGQAGVAAGVRVGTRVTGAVAVWLPYAELLSRRGAVERAVRAAAARAATALTTHPTAV
jgi:IclR family transcriptional regulator, acetate operon repressor